MDNNEKGDFVNAFDRLIVYSEIRNDHIIKSLSSFFRGSGGTCEDYPAKQSGLILSLIKAAEEHGLYGDIFKQYLIFIFLRSENIFSLSSEKGIVDKNKTLYKLAVAEAAILAELLRIDIANILPAIKAVLPYEPNKRHTDSYICMIQNETDPALITETLCHSYGQMGCGDSYGYGMFRFSGGRLSGIKNCDIVDFDDIIGYELQKEELIGNTLLFLDNKPANNVLLSGARGTGKSSCVKALINKFYDRGLRLVEVGKEQLVNLPEIMEILSERGKRFILFFDDLSFEDFEVEYKRLKSLLEGGAERRPNNVLFYATSNRRHLIHEKWRDKDGTVIDGGEIHVSDTVNEKLSLKDRFGLTIYFPKPNPAEFMNIVTRLAKRALPDISDEYIKKSAAEWELNQNGLSGRTAKQFVIKLTGENIEMNGKNLSEASGRDKYD